ncbi:MAG: methyltransferase domain-containing protein, partial [Gammaproteobacteria bacterium]
PGQSVLELFCGLGNFSLPLARSAGQVVGIEGEARLVERARANARLNNLHNVEFHYTDLYATPLAGGWLAGSYAGLLLDPPRAGACEVLAALGARLPPRIVYVSCHPATLARDAGLLVNVYGYRLTAVGVFDMFPHTAHVEALAALERSG